MPTALTRINGYAHVAERYGLEEAIFLDSIAYWYRTNRANNHNFRDGRWWTHNSIKAFVDVFPWWSVKQIRRIAASCREQRALIAGEFNEDRRDRSLWYTPSDELLALYGMEAETGKCTCPSGQMQTPEEANSFALMGSCNIRKPCSTHVETDMTPCSPPSGDGASAGAEPEDGPAPGDKPGAKAGKGRREKSAPAHDPEAFDTFWKAYPRKDDRKAAIRAWDKLKPDRALCRVMYAALKRQRRSPQWAEDDGKYIPLFSTWLNGRKWENEGVDLSLLDRPREPKEPIGGWLPDPEAPS